MNIQSFYMVSLFSTPESSVMSFNYCFYVNVHCGCAGSHTVHVKPTRTKQQDQSEAQGQEAGPQQVPQSREVRDGVVVWIQAPSPQTAHHQTSHVEQNDHLHDDNGWIYSIYTSVLKS